MAKPKEKMIISKKDLAENLADNLSDVVKTKVAANQIVDALFEDVSANLQEGNDVKVAGFGAFITKERKARVGRNPATGESVKIPKRTVMAFKASKNLKDSL